jgi:aspartate racemase
MHIGLIGGIGPAAQDYYTRRLIALFRAAGVPLVMTTAHADTAQLLAHQAAGQHDAQAAVFAALSERLARAGADVVAVTSIAGHFCRQAFAARSALPVVDMIDAVAAWVARQGLTRLGILGTRLVMETRLYGSLSAATVLAPPEPQLSQVHDAYVAMAAAGVISPAQQQLFHSAARQLIDEAGAQAIMLGGTDLALAFDPANAPFRLVDCAAIHAQALADLALGAAAAPTAD